MLCGTSSRAAKGRSKPLWHRLRQRQPLTLIALTADTRNTRRPLVVHGMCQRFKYTGPYAYHLTSTDVSK